MKIELKFVAEEAGAEISASGDSLSKAILKLLLRFQVVFGDVDSRVYATLASVAEKYEDGETQITEFSSDFSCPEDNFSITLIVH